MINRRKFIKLCTFASAGVALDVLPVKLFLPGAAGQSGRGKTRVAVIRSQNVWKGIRPDTMVIKEMLNEGVRFLADSTDTVNSWKSFFSSRDRIAMKVNPIARQTGSTKPELCNALASAIHENTNAAISDMMIFDVSGDDLKGAGFIQAAGPHQISVRQTEDYSEIFRVNGVEARISRIITDECSALINVPLLKTHKSAGLSAAMKNHYGSIPKSMVRDDKYRFHKDRFKNIAFLNFMQPIIDKQRLIVVDGLEAQFDGGPRGDPRFQWRFNGVIMGTDPVAVDTVCLSIINDRRLEKGFAPLSLEYLDWARKQGVGTNLSGEIAVYENKLVFGENNV